MMQIVGSLSGVEKGRPDVDTSSAIGFGVVFTRLTQSVRGEHYLGECMACMHHYLASVAGHTTLHEFG